jgi:hypothetical protein
MPYMNVPVRYLSSSISHSRNKKDPFSLLCAVSFYRLLAPLSYSSTTVVTRPLGFLTLTA